MSIPTLIVYIGYIWLLSMFVLDYFHNYHVWLSLAICLNLVT